MNSNLLFSIKISIGPPSSWAGAYQQLGLLYYFISALYVTFTYLILVIKGVIFNVKRHQLKIGIVTDKNINKIMLYEHMMAIKNQKDQGFDFYHLPNKQYLLDLIYFFQPEYTIFQIRPQSSQTVPSIKFPIELFKSVNNQVLPSDFAAPLIKKTDEQRDKEKSLKLESRLKKKERRLQLLKLEAEKAQKLFQEIKQEMDEHEA